MRPGRLAHGGGRQRRRRQGRRREHGGGEAAEQLHRDGVSDIRAEQERAEFQELGGAEAGHERGRPGRSSHRDRRRCGRLCWGRPRPWPEEGPQGQRPETHGPPRLVHPVPSRQQRRPRPRRGRRRSDGGGERRVAAARLLFEEGLAANVLGIGPQRRRRPAPPHEPQGHRQQLRGLRGRRPARLLLVDARGRQRRQRGRGGGERSHHLHGQPPGQPPSHHGRLHPQAHGGRESGRRVERGAEGRRPLEQWRRRRQHHARPIQDHPTGVGKPRGRAGSQRRRRRCPQRQQRDKHGR
mmetsp:Transcript_35005/g.74675  ORF Transcript_35005/g.74675 Transcript_35005/m.74675 type:complete len:296 (-) Transcript_35005:491-1378(-)